jgi:hypothetical protein
MADDKPAKPIKFNVRGDKTGRTEAEAPVSKPQAGRRAADSYVEELKKQLG